MKIAVISHAYQEKRYRTTLRCMAEDPDVEMCLIHPATYKGVACCPREAGVLRSIAVPIRLGSRQGTFIYRPKALDHALDVVRPDLILHEQEVYTLGAAQVAAVARRRSIPLIEFVWENVHRSLTFPRDLIRKYVLSRASAVITGSSGAAEVHRDWGFNGPIAVIPQMGVRLSSQVFPGRRGLDVLKVCFVGRLEPCKGVDCLLRGIAVLARSGVPVTCRIAGEGRELERLRGMVRALGIEGAARFCGQLSGEAVRALLRSSDVLILSSRRTPVWQEQFGLVLTEAMAEGAVTVGSRTGAIPEVIGCPELLFEEDDVEGLAAILGRLATEGDFYAICRETLWNRVQDLYSVESLSARKLRFLRSVLEEVRSRAMNEPATRNQLELRLR